MGALTTRDTIAAVATPPGIGGVGIVRISGPRVPEIARSLLGRLPAARHASFSRFRSADGSTLDEGLALYFPAPHSSLVIMYRLRGGGPVLDLLLRKRCAPWRARRAPASSVSAHSECSSTFQAKCGGSVETPRPGGARCVRSLDGAFSPVCTTSRTTD
jgi:tRNA modification GTPase